MRFFRFSPVRLALSYMLLGLIVLALFAVPLWYAWSENVGTFRAYVQGDELAKFTEAFEREGSTGIVDLMQSRGKNLAEDSVMILADPSKAQLAGNLPFWPSEVPEAAGTYGLVIDVGGGSTMRVVVTHVPLPGGYRLLLGKESARFQSLVELFWYGIAGALGFVLVLGAVLGWAFRRALLSEVQEVSRAAAAIAPGDPMRRLPTHSASTELDALARTVNGMLDQLSAQNARLESEIAVRRKAEQALLRAHHDSEAKVAQRTQELARANESLRLSETSLAEAQKLSHTGSFSWRPGTGEIAWSEEMYRIFEYQPELAPTLELARHRIHPEDVAHFEELAARVAQEAKGFEFEHRILLPDGRVKHLRVLGRSAAGDSGEVEEVLGAVMDVTARHVAQQLLNGEKRLLEMIAKASAPCATLEELCALVEALFPRIVCSILLLDRNGRQLRHGAAPSLPKAFVQALDSLMGERLGGAAALPGERVIVEDIATDPLWADCRELAIGHGLRARWLTPIWSQQGKLLGTFALYSRESGRPAAQQLEVIEQLAHVGSIAIERARAEEELQTQKAHLDALFDLAPDSIVLTSLRNPTNLRINREFTRMFGYTAEEAMGRRMRELIAPEELGPIGLTENPDLLAGKKVEREVVRQRKDGTRFHAHVTARRLWLADDDDSAYVIYRDITERKAAEDKLRRSEAFLAEGQRISHTGSWGWRLSSGEVVWSEEQFRLLGFQSGATTPSMESFLSVVHPDDKARVARALEEATAERKQYEIDYRVLLPSRGVRHLRSVGRPVAGRVGDVDEYIGITIDVTERVHAEAALRHSEERYALAMRAAGEGHWDWNIVTGEYYASPRMLEMCGFPPDMSFAGRDDLLLQLPFHPEDRPKWQAALDAHFAGDTARYESEIRIVPHGETRWIHLTGLLLRGEHHAPMRWTGAVTDVTARKHVEEELRARQEMLDLAQKAARAVAFEWRIKAADKENRWSADLEAMHGLTPGSYDGTLDAWRKLMHQDDWPAVRDAIEHAHESGEVDAEYRVLQSDGAVRWLQVKGRMFLDEAQRPDRILGFVLDVTDRRQATEELRRLERQLRQAQRLEAMGTLAGGIAHDFNNILGAILGYGEMALRDAAEGSRLRRDLESILTAGERGRALVDRVLTFSRSGLGERVPVNVQNVVQEALDVVAATLAGAIRIETRLEAGRAAMMGEPTQVYQVVVNLATNSVQAMPRGGKLTVALETQRIEFKRSATIGTIVPAEYIVLRVSDTGTGIAPEILDRIFDPFFTTKEVNVGTGLGLSLVHGIVAEVKGAIDVESTVGAGSTFTVFLPRADDAEETLEDERQMPRGAGQRVMVVDDEEPLVRLATETLDELGYMPVGFTSSTAALDAFRADPAAFDVVITDERMPGVSGSALIREVRRMRRSVPIMLVSGYVGGMVTGNAYNEGADEVLKKPLSAHDLASSLARVLRP